MELGDLFVTDAVGKKSGWSASHDMDLIWRTWRSLCREGMNPRLVESALSSIIETAKFASNGLGEPMTQRDMLVWCISKWSTDLSLAPDLLSLADDRDDRDVMTAFLHRCLSAAIEARVIWRSTPP
jgi:hypothetical protein